MNIASIGKISKELGSEIYSLYVLYENGFRIPSTYILPYYSLDEDISNNFDSKLTRFTLRVSFLNEDDRYKAKNFMRSSYFPCVKLEELNKSIEMLKKKFSGAPFSIVLQQLLAAKKSGVVASVNPLYNDRNVIMLNAIYGNIYPLLEGKISPFEAIVDKASGKPILIRSFKQKYEYVIEEDSCKVVRKPISKSTFPLSTGELKVIVKDVIKMEKILNSSFIVNFVINDEGNVFYTEVFNL
ncbi:MAG: hypothetical protein OWQ54_09525 [Sulfolobaceae archaeon]|nr:hypothetical protein [Sulfolobaceae archaeon]